MTELEMRMQEMARQNPFAMNSNLELESAEPDRVVFRLAIKPEHKNFFGMVHGGAIYTMADTAAGFAAQTDGRFYVTQTSAMHFLRNQGSGVVRAVATIRHRGKSTCLVAVDILSGDTGKLMATSEFTFFCVDKEIMDAKRDNR